MDLCLDGLTDDELRAQLTTWAGRVAAGEAVLLRLLGELDAREAWAQHGVLSCAHWASWQLGWSITTSQERVRVARVLRSLPLLSEALGHGRLSYAQVRAITRVATVSDEATWVELARHATAAQLEKAVRGARRARRNEVKAADPERVAWEDRPRTRWDDDGTLVLTMRIAAEHAPAVLAALEQAQQAEQADRDTQLQQLAVSLAGGPSAEGARVEDLSATSPEPYVYEEPPYPVLTPRDSIFTPRPPEDLARLDAWRAEVARRHAKADAYRAYQDHLAREAAARELPAAKATLADGLVRALTRPLGKAAKVQLLVDPVSGWARTSKDELLPPSTLRALLRTLPGQQRPPRLRPLTPADLRRLDRGRDSRTVPDALRALLGQLDGERCRFPSCTRTHTLHAHHVRFWRDGGPTDLSNLVLICSRHHTLIHLEGYQLALLPDRTLQVHAADGTRLLHYPTLPWEPAGDLPTDHLTPDTLPTQWTGERMDLGYVVNVLLQHAA